MIVWVFGPLLGFGALHPFESELARIIAVAVIFIGWLIENLVHKLRAAKQEKGLVDGVAAQAKDPNETASAEEVALLAERLKEALAALKKAKLGRGRRRLAVSASLVHVHRPAGLRQDHRADQLRAEFPARRASSARRPCAASAARATAIGGSPTMPC